MFNVLIIIIDFNALIHCIYNLNEKCDALFKYIHQIETVSTKNYPTDNILILMCYIRYYNNYDIIVHMHTHKSITK